MVEKSFLRSVGAHLQSLNRMVDTATVTLPDYTRAAAKSSSSSRRSSGQTLLSEGFEDETFPPEGWEVKDADGDGQGWFRGISPCHTGNGNAASNSLIPGPYGGELDPDNWLITPQINIPQEGVYRLRYWIGYANPQFPNDKHGVFVSTTGTDPDDFEEIHSEVNHIVGGANYYEVQLSLEKYAGKNIYIAFRHYESKGVYQMLLDDVTVDEMPSSPVFEGAESMDFGTVLDIVPTKSADYKIKNTGTEPLVITEATGKDFSFKGLPLTIDPMGEGSITVNLLSIEVGKYEGGFTLKTNDPLHPNVSVGVTADIQKAVRTGFCYETFDKQIVPDGWMYYGFLQNKGTGINGSSSYRAAVEGIYTLMFTTHFVDMGKDPSVTFHYRMIDPVTGKATPAENVLFGVYVSDDYGASYNLIYKEEPKSANEHEPSADYKPLTLSLSQYAGKTCIIGVQVVSVNGGVYACDIDNVSIGTKPSADIAAVSIEGVQKPTVGSASVYGMAVENIGNAPLDGYTVSLSKADGTVIATKQGEPINVNEIKTYRFNWVPSVAGDEELYGKVSFVGDENTDNDMTLPLEVNVLDEGLFALQVGESDMKAYNPANFFYDESATQNIYYASELGVNGGTINSLSYTTEFNEAYVSPTIRIWVGETDKDNFSDKQWIDVSQLTEVFSGPLSIPAGKSECHIEFNEPYEYKGKNLVVYVLQTDANSTFYGFFFNSMYTGSQRTLGSVVAYGPQLTPENPGQGNPNDYLPNTSFFMNFKGMGALSGTVTSGGEAVPGVRVNLDGTELYAMTDIEGKYKFAHLKPGSYTITAQHAGYEAMNQTAVIGEGATTTVDMQLSPKTFVTLSGVIKSETDTPIVGAEVRLGDEKKAVSDADGAYVISGLDVNATYEVLVTSHGYLDYKAKVATENADLTHDVVMVMTPRPVQLVRAVAEGQSVTVSWDKPGTTDETNFRHDSGIKIGQLGITEAKPYALLGTVYKTPAELYDIQWLLSSADNHPHSKVDLYVLDLDANGLPTQKVIYKAEGVSNNDDVWNTHVLETPIRAPHGFMLAVSNAYGFVGLGTAVSTDEYPFKEASNFYTMDYTSSPFIALEDANNPLNFMIRASGIDATGRLDAAKKALHMASAKTESYIVYRLKDGDKQNKWTRLGTTQGSLYADDSWSSLAPGAYRYAVVADYGERQSVPAITDIMPKDMEVSVTVKLETASDLGVDSAVITLTCADGKAEHVYTKVAEASETLFENVWKGSYRITVTREGYETYDADGVDISSSRTITVALSAKLVKPYGLKVQDEGDGWLLSWNNEASVAFWDDMESYKDFIIDGIGDYTLKDVDQLPTWVLSYTESAAYQYENNGYTGSFIVMNPSATVPVMTDTDTHSGAKALACVAANTSYGPGHNDDWLILPKVKVEKGTKFRFWAKSASSYYGKERINVLISADGTDTEDFFSLSGDTYVEVPTEWTEYEFDIDGFDGEEVSLAINCVSASAYMLLVDDIYVGTGSDDEAHYVTAPSAYKVWLDGKEVATTDGSNHKFIGLGMGRHTAGVSAVYDFGESEVSMLSFYVGTTGISDVEAAGDGVVLSPNPFVDEIRISDPSKVKSLRIVNVGGQVVADISSPGSVVYTGGMPSGIYFVSVDYADGSKTVHKMVKN